MKKLKKKVISQLKEELGELKVEKELLQKCFLEKVVIFFPTEVNFFLYLSLS